MTGVHAHASEIFSPIISPIRRARGRDSAAIILHVILHDYNIPTATESDRQSQRYIEYIIIYYYILLYDPASDPLR